MNELSKDEMLAMLSRSITAKVNKEPNPFAEIHKRISDELITAIYRWRSTARPENSITAETTALLEDLEKSIYMINKNHHDKNNRNGQK